MKKSRSNKTVKRLGQTLITIATLLLTFHMVSAASLAPDIEAKIKTYQAKLAEWATDKDIINAIEEMNKQQVSMTNEKWKSIAKGDKQVLKFQTSKVGKKLSQWQQDKDLGKLLIRNKDGNLVAGSIKPAVFNIGDRPAFTKAVDKNGWHSTKVKPDPTTKTASIQVSHPVMSNGKKIGVIHTAIAVN